MTTLPLFGETPAEVEPLEFTVYGRPAPQGSKSAFPIWAKWRAAWAKPDGTCPTCGQKEYRGTGLADDSDYLKAWRAAVRSAAAQAWHRPVIAEPVAVGAVFYIRRANDHYRPGKFAALLKPAAPDYPVRPAGHDPDLDKLLRAVGDALTGVVLADDGLVQRYVEPAKYYAGGPCPGPGLAKPGAVIRVWIVRRDTKGTDDGQA